MRVLLHGVEAHVGVVSGSGVVAHLAVVGAQLQVVHPADILHEIFFTDDPVGSHAAKVTPAAVRMETRGTVAAERYFEIVAVAVVIADASQVAFRAVVVLVAVQAGHLGEVAEIGTSGKNLRRLESIQIIIVIGEILVRQQHVQQMPAEEMRPLQLLLEGVALVAVEFTASAAVATLSVADDGVVVSRIVRLTQVHVALYGEREILQLDIHIGDALQRIAHGLVLVQFVFPYHVAVGILIAGSYLDALVVSVVAGIVLSLPVGCQAVRAIGVMQMHRVNGRNLAAIHEGIGERRILVAGRNLGILMAARQVDSRLQPAHWRHIDRHTSRKTIEARIAHVTLFIEVAQREIIVALLVGCIAAEEIFLTVSVADRRLVPIEIFSVTGQYLHACS